MMRTSLRRREFLENIAEAGAFLAMPGAAATAMQPARRKPDIVFIMADDLEWDGRDILPPLAGKKTELEPRVFYWKFKTGQIIRSGDWKLIVRPDKPDELYNIAADPYETTDEARRRPDRVAEMRILLRRNASLDGQGKGA